MRCCGRGSGGFSIWAACPRNRAPPERVAGSRASGPGKPTGRTLAASLVAAIAALGLAAGCGGHGPFTTSTGQGGAAARTPRQRGGGSLTAARALAFAAAVNLTAADVPGFQPSNPVAEHKDPAEQRLERRFLSCIGARPAAFAGGAEQGSPRFTRRGSWMRA